MEAMKKWIHVVLLVMQFKVALTFLSVDETRLVYDHSMKINDSFCTVYLAVDVGYEQYFLVVLFIMLYKVVLTLKPRSNDRNIPTQHMATLWGATCCVRLATVLRHVGCCWLKFEKGQI